MKKKLVIAIDGPSGAGKSTVARLLAERLGYVYIDSGAMYRAIGLKAKREKVDIGDEAALAKLCERTKVTLQNSNQGNRIFLDGVDVSEEIRTAEMGMMASAVSKSPAVRSRLLGIQREFGADGGIVMDGRDIGTVIFPEAAAKFYLDAGVEERSNRRYRELKAKDQDVTIDQIRREIEQRDMQDAGREIAPLMRASDAIVLDTTRMGIHEVLEAMLTELRKKV